MLADDVKCPLCIGEALIEQDVVTAVTGNRREQDRIEVQYDYAHDWAYNCCDNYPTALSYYEFKDGLFGECRLPDPYPAHLAGVYLVNSPTLKKWALCKNLDSGLQYGPVAYEEEMMPS